MVTYGLKSDLILAFGSASSRFSYKYAHGMPWYVSTLKTIEKFQAIYRINKMRMAQNEK